MSANGVRQRLGDGDGDAANGSVPAWGLRAMRAAGFQADAARSVACSGIGEMAAMARPVCGGG